MSRKEIYLAYLQTEHWFHLSREAKRLAGFQCECCRISGVNLDGHHLIYREPLEDCVPRDIMSLCRKCHDAWHRWQENQTHRWNDYDRNFVRKTIQKWRASKEPQRALPKPQFVGKTPTKEGEWERFRHCVIQGIRLYPQREAFRQYLNRKKTKHFWTYLQSKAWNLFYGNSSA